jgi:hypothetical protein
MGAHVSYPLVIYHLVSLKSQFHFITDKKFQGVIKELSNFEIYPNSDNNHLPDWKALSVNPWITENIDFYVCGMCLTGMVVDLLCMNLRYNLSRKYFILLSVKQESWYYDEDRKQQNQE